MSDINGADAATMGNAFVLSVDQEREQMLFDVFRASGLGLPRHVQGPSDIVGLGACTLGHKKMTEAARDAGMDWHIQFEDDAYPCSKIVDRLSGMNFPDADVYLLGYSRMRFKPRTVDGWDELPVDDRCCGTHAILIRKSAYDFLIGAWGKCKCADSVWGLRKEIDPGIKVVVLHDPAFIQYNHIRSVINKHLGYIFNGDHDSPPAGFPDIRKLLK